MRYTYEHMKSMLQGAYKKLKSYYFYDKTLLFIKKKIAEFESDDGCFQQTFDVLAKALISENSAYFEELINQLDYRVFPKRLVAASAPTSTIVGTIDHHKNIAKVNFFIDVPIELLILDCLWTLCIAKISNKKYGTQACSYAGKFKASVFYFDQDDLYEGIDWESNRCFEPYYENYSRWQKDAFSKLRQGLLVQNQLMLSLDLKSFYYSVRFEFDSLSALLSDDSRLSEISFISQRRKVKDFFIKFKKKSHFADFFTKHTLDFVLHRLLGGLAEMHTDDIGCLADLLSHSRARGTVGCGIVHSKSSCK